MKSCWQLTLHRCTLTHSHINDLLKPFQFPSDVSVIMQIFDVCVDTLYIPDALHGILLITAQLSNKFQTPNKTRTSSAGSSVCAQRPHCTWTNWTADAFAAATAAADDGGGGSYRADGAGAGRRHRACPACPCASADPHWPSAGRRLSVRTTMSPPQGNRAFAWQQLASFRP